MRKIRIIAFTVIYAVHLGCLPFIDHATNWTVWDFLLKLPIAMIASTLVFMIVFEIIASFIIIFFFPFGHPLRQELCHPRPTKKHWATRMEEAASKCDVRYDRVTDKQHGYCDPILALRPWWDRLPPSSFFILSQKSHSRNCASARQSTVSGRFGKCLRAYTHIRSRLPSSCCSLRRRRATFLP